MVNTILLILQRRIKEMKEEFCSYCNRKIYRNAADFYMPKLPAWNKLYDLSENVYHIECIKTLDDVRYVGKELADLTEKISRVSKDAPFLIRNGNIIVLGDMNEMSIEINDFEDFVQFNIPVAHLNCIDDLQYPEVLQNRTTSISFLQNGKLKLITFYYEIELDCLSLLRLKEIVKGIKDLNIFSNIENLHYFTTF